jgi:hypothetical protein
MKNRWTIERALATWVADLTPFAKQPDILLDWMETVWQAGAETSIYVPLKIESSQYRRADDVRGYDPTLMKQIRATFARTHVLDVFRDHSVGVEIASRMAYWEGERVVEEFVPDPYCLQLRFRPNIDQEDPDLTHVYGFLDLRGPGLDFNDPNMRGVFHPTVRVGFSIHSTIWLPWFSSRFQDDMEYADLYFDNSELATRHTPRLNQFLLAVREKTQAIGAEWSLDHNVLGPRAVSVTGVNIDDPIPSDYIANPIDK